MRMKPQTESLDPPDAAPLIALRNVSKRFGSLWANRDISLEIHEGEIHAVVGENGAGKSTLMKMLYGHIHPDAGRIYLRGKPAVLRHPREAMQAGIGMVHQQLLIFPQLTALENVIVGCEPRKWGWIKRKEAAARVGELCRLFGFDLPFDLAAEELSFAQRQQIELLRVLFRGARVLILDEPTSLLAPPEVEQLLQFLKSLKREGHTILFISHRLGEVFALADRISILRKGRSIGTVTTATTTPEEVARAMVGGSLEDSSASIILPATAQPIASQESERSAPSSPSLKPCLELQHIFVRSTSQEPGLTDFSLCIREGEVFGIGGVVGNGQGTLARALTGIASVEGGSIFLDGRNITLYSPDMRAKAGLRWLPANPSEEALMTAASIEDNVILGRQREPFCQTGGRLLRGAIKRWAHAQLKAGEVVFSDMEDSLATLSGGNQQKVALTRVLEGKPRLVILEQPGRGLDVRAQERLRRRVLDLNSNGVAFLLLSHDLDELLSLSRRVAVLYRGKIMGVMDRDQASRETLGRWMLGVEESVVCATGEGMKESCEWANNG